MGIWVGLQYAASFDSPSMLNPGECANPNRRAIVNVSNRSFSSGWRQSSLAQTDDSVSLMVERFCHRSHFVCKTSIAEMGRIALKYRGRFTQAFFNLR
jgi:hypothetical protein